MTGHDIHTYIQTGQGIMRGRAYIQTGRHTCIYAYRTTDILTYIQAGRHTYRHTYRQAHSTSTGRQSIHTYSQTHIHKNIHTD